MKLQLLWNLLVNIFLFDKIKFVQPFKSKVLTNMCLNFLDILDNLIDTNKSNNHMISEDIWEEININTRTRLKDLKDVHNQIWSNIVCS